MASTIPVRYGVDTRRGRGSDYRSWLGFRIPVQICLRQRPVAESCCCVEMGVDNVGAKPYLICINSVVNMHGESYENDS